MIKIKKWNKSESPLDQIDRKIIRLLQKNGRLPIASIAKEINVSETTVRTRLKRLIENETIKIVAVSNPLKLGFEIIGNLKIHADLKRKDFILEHLKEIPAVNYVALTTGGTDIEAEFIAGSLEEFKRLIFEKISPIEGIKSIQTSLIVEIVKDTWDWGTAWD